MIVAFQIKQKIHRENIALGFAANGHMTRIGGDTLDDDYVYVKVDGYVPGKILQDVKSIVESDRHDSDKVTDIIDFIKKAENGVY